LDAVRFGYLWPLTEAAFKEAIFPTIFSQTGDLFPGAHEPLQEKNQIFVLDQSAELDSVRKGSKSAYIFGEVDYSDVFNKKHWARFCYKIGIDLKPLGECTIHNDSDSDYPQGYRPK
jgi:hypothetical protein